MIKISKRLETISSLIPINSNIIDIGCDHGLLDIYLYQNKISKKIIATDIKQSALDNANNNIKKYKLEKYIETRLGNGLDVLSEEDDINTIVISGMGTHTIIGILKDNKSKLRNINTIIVQSNTKIELLRKEIIKLNYLIEDEMIVEDNNKIYIAIKFIKGNRKYSKKELFFGPILLKKQSETYKKYHQNELKKLYLLNNMLDKRNWLLKLKNKRKIIFYKKNGINKSTLK